MKTRNRNDLICDGSENGGAYPRTGFKHTFHLASHLIYKDFSNPYFAFNDLVLQGIDKLLSPVNDFKNWICIMRALVS